MSLDLAANESPNPFTEQEEDARRTVRAFLDAELEPHYEKFVGDLDYDREFWRKAGKVRILGASIPEEYGGPGLSQIVHCVISQELGRSVGGATIGSSLEADLATHIMWSVAPPEFRDRYLPRIMAGESSQAFGLTEPEAGSDATAIRTTAVRDGEHYVINGSKVFISNGMKADVIYVVAKTDTSKRGSGMSMFLVEGDTPGLSRSRQWTMGYEAYDLAELHFDDMRVPAGNLLLGEGRAMEVLMSTFAADRLQVSARALGEAELALRLTVEHVTERRAFGQRIADFQNTQFVLADMQTDIEVGRALLFDGVRKHRAGVLDFAGAARIKLWIPQMTTRVLDRALQLFGGSGFMREMPISRLYTANRLHRIYAGTDELQKVTIARSMIGRPDRRN